MFRLLRNEFRKLGWTWVAAILAIGAILPPGLAIFNSWSNAQHDPQARFDFTVIYRWANMYASSLINFLLLALVSSYVLYREYQEKTLAALLVIPVARRKLLHAKIQFSAVLCLALAAGSFLVATLIGLAAGAPGLSPGLAAISLWRFAVSASAMLPCLVAGLVVTMVARNFLVAAGFSVAMIFISALILSIGDLAIYFPWSYPYLVGIEPEYLRDSGLDGSVLPMVWGFFGIFAIAVTALAYRVFTTADSE